MDKIRELLKSTLISEIMTKKDLILLSPKETVSNALNILSQNSITSSAIYDPEKNSFLGFVDVLDISLFIATVFSQNFQKHPHLYDPKELKQQFLCPVADVMNISKRDPFIPVDASWSLDILVQNFLRWGIHRVPVISQNQFVGIISQSDVVRFIASKSSSWSEIDLISISQMKLAQGNVVAVFNADNLMKAFNTILTHRVSGLAIVDLKGHLVNNLSASDLKGITESSFFKLEMPIHQILASTSEKLPPILVKAHQSLGYLLSLFESKGVHRIYVVDDEDRPTNVISLTKLLEVISSA